jgi:hypothetical protein
MSVDVFIGSRGSVDLGAWLQVLGGSNVDHDATAAGRKRAAPAAPVVSDAEVVTNINWKELVEKGTIKSKTNDMLKQYLRHYKLSTAGRKAELLDRVSQHVMSSS